jgi:S-adenosylmethionine:tRNA-ribosyltransferase-isomerase (queuine synthetase)
MTRKGHTNNPNGRPAGRPNKVTTEIKTRIKMFLDDNWQQFEQDFRQLEPKDRVTLIKDLLKFAAPIQREQDFKVNFNELNDAQMDEIINKMLDNYGTK